MFGFYFRTMKTYVNYKVNRYNPFVIFFLITRKCNLDCPKCFVSKRFSSKNELSTSKIFSLIEDASSIGVCYFSITGGEPLLRKDLIKIGKKIKEEGMVASLSTNGCLITKESAKDLVNTFDFIRVSLDGFKDSNDKMRGKGSFERTLRGIEHLISIKKRKTKIGIASVIDDSNYKNVEQFFDFFKNKVDFITFQPFYTRNYVFSNPDFVNTWRKIKEENEEKMADLNEFIGVPSLKEGKKFCDAAKLYLTIDSTGNVYPCLIEKSNPIGNLRENSLKEIWKSNDIQIARNMVKNCSGCYSKCTTEISKVFRKSSFDVIIQSPKLIKVFRSK